MKLRTLVVGLVGAATALNYHCKRSPDSEISRTVKTIMAHPTVAGARAKVARKAGDFVRAQGEALTDKVAEKIKEQLFAPRSAPTGEANASGGETKNPAARFSEAAPGIVEGTQSSSRGEQPRRPARAISSPREVSSPRERR